jgi:hypothetical protein
MNTLRLGPDQEGFGFVAKASGGCLEDGTR